MNVHGLREWRHLNGRLGLRAAVWLQGKVCERGLELWPRLNDGPVCDAQCCWGCICKWALPLPITYNPIRVQGQHSIMSRIITPTIINSISKCLKSDVYWELMNTCRQTNMFLEHRSKARSRDLLNLPRNLLRTVMGIITGHNTLSRHMNIMGLNNDPLCKHCEGELETSLHFISQCSYYVTTRMSIWGNPVLDPDDMKRIRVKDLARFILKSRRFLVNEKSD